MKKKKDLKAIGILSSSDNCLDYGIHFMRSFVQWTVCNLHEVVVCVSVYVCVCVCMCVWRLTCKYCLTLLKSTASTIFFLSDIFLIAAALLVLYVFISYIKMAIINGPKYIRYKPFCQCKRDSLQKL